MKTAKHQNQKILFLKQNFTFLSPVSKHAKPKKLIIIWLRNEINYKVVIT